MLPRARRGVHSHMHSSQRSCPRTLTYVGMGKYSEENARYFTFKLLNAVLYLHDLNICHRDLKPENILLGSKAPDAELKISDFGLSKIVALSHDFLMTTRCGTPVSAHSPIGAWRRSTPNAPPRRTGLRRARGALPRGERRRATQVRHLVRHVVRRRHRLHSALR